MVKYTYNDLWQEEERTYYGTAEERVTDNEGFAGYFFAYDDRGTRQLSGIWIQPAIIADMIIQAVKEYDEYDNLISDNNFYYFISDDGETEYQLIDSNI